MLSVSVSFPLFASIVLLSSLSSGATSNLVVPYFFSCSSLSPSMLSFPHLFRALCPFRKSIAGTARAHSAQRPETVFKERSAGTLQRIHSATTYVMES